MRLGGGPSILDLFPDKPPKMRWQTYGRARAAGLFDGQTWARVHTRVAALASDQNTSG
jgi:hypothetical protein